MTYTPIPKGTPNWDVPLNSALAQLDSNITTASGNALQAASNLSDLTNVAQARSNLQISAGATVGGTYQNVRDYGAIGNGVADDTAAINAAIAAVPTNGGTVLFPSGTYKITSTLNATVTGTHFIGVGWASQILFDGNVVATAVKANTNMRMFIRDLRISQSNVAHFGTAIDASNFNSSTIERVLIDGGGGGVAPLKGIVMNAATCFYNEIRACRVNYGGTTSTGITIAGGANSNSIIDVRVIPQGDDVNSAGVYVTNAHSTTMIHPDIEAAAGAGIFLDTAAHGTTIVNAYSEGNNINLRIASGVIAPTITGGTYQSGVVANIQDNGAISSSVINAWPNSGTNSYNHVDITNTDAYNINGVSVPASTYQSSDLGFHGWTYDPAVTSNTSLAVSGTVFLAKVQLRYPRTISKLAVGVGSAGTTITANQNFLGLYDSAGTLHAVTTAGAIDAALATTGLINQSVVTPYAAPAGNYWVALLTNFTGTAPGLSRGSGSSLTIANGGAAASAYRFATNGTARTTLAASITPGSNSLTNAFTMWAAVS